MAKNLEIELVYLYPTENSLHHKTDKFELVHDEVNPIGIFRRGFKFTVGLRFKGRAYRKGIDIVRLYFNFGEAPNAMKGTKGVVTIDGRKSDKLNPNEWSGGILRETADTLTLEVQSPTDAPVGLWKLQVETRVANSTSPQRIYNHPSDLYILFNPWHPDDLTYMPDQRLLDEYVLNDVGKIWIGAYGTCRGREWVFGQFDACVLPAATMMFKRGRLNPLLRGDPIRVCRFISKLVNSNDDRGILQGRWDGDYEDGTAPTSWTGSVPILQEYLETGNPVSYGQCWVFGGLTATICRALGIPSRVLSNLVSAHDSNSSLTIDKYYDENFEEISDLRNPDGDDSVWNYHVWNDVWMARPDLPKGYGGWQAIDATPQETSDGVYQCGPASLEAIKRGEVAFNYDVTFMIASVNADYMCWQEDPTNERGFRRFNCNKYNIGRMILTKQPYMFDPNGDKDRQDITLQYKAKEGTEAERLALYNAVRATRSARAFFEVPESVTEDVAFELVDIDKINIGQPFDLTINVKNNSKEERIIRAVLNVGSCYYTGIKANTIKKYESNFKMRPNSTEKLTMTVLPDEYLDKLVEYCIIKFSVIMAVRETRQTWADEDDFQVIKPSIEIKVPKVIPLKKRTRATLQFTNPLPKALTKCKFNISGSGLIRNQVIPYPDVKPGALVKVGVDVIPKNIGDQTLIATFDSQELTDVTGSIKVDVFDDSE